MLGSFGWRVVRQDKDSVIVTQARPKAPDFHSGKGRQREEILEPVLPLAVY